MEPNQLYIDPILRILDPAHRELAPENRSLGFTRAQVKGIDEQARTVTAIVSTANVDRYEEIIEPEAYRKHLAAFMMNPVMLAGHAHSTADGRPSVIGHWKDVRITKEGLIGTAQFSRTPLGEEWWQLYLDGSMRAFSVGFIASKWEMRDMKTPGGESRRLRVFTEVELLEISAVAIPANREALVLAASAMTGRAASADLDVSDYKNAGDIKLSNRQLESAVRALRPLIQKEIRRELDPLQNSALENLISDVTRTCMSMHNVGGCGGGDGWEGDYMAGDGGTDSAADAYFDDTYDGVNGKSAPGATSGGNDDQGVEDLLRAILDSPAEGG